MVPAFFLECLERLVSLTFSCVFDFVGGFTNNWVALVVIGCAFPLVGNWKLNASARRNRNPTRMWNRYFSILILYLVDGIISDEFELRFFLRLLRLNSEGASSLAFSMIVGICWLWAASIDCTSFWDQAVSEAPPYNSEIICGVFYRVAGSQAMRAVIWRV